MNHLSRCQIGLAAILAVFVPAAAAAVTPKTPRQDLPADAGWKFQLGDAAGAENPTFADSSWRTVDLPHDWSIES